MPNLTKVKVTSIGDLVVDAFLSESHEYKASITKHKVEGGSQISDHIATEPLALNIEGIVSDTPIGAVAVARGIAQGAMSLIGGSDDQSYSDLAQEYLEELFESKRLVTIETSRGTYKNMGCSSLTFPVDAQTGFALQFSATFEELTIVENIRAQRPVGQKRAKTKTKGGNKPPKQPTSAQRIGAVMEKLEFQRKNVLWRKGNPPGGPVIVAQESVYWAIFKAFDITDTGLGGQWFHDGTDKPLTPTELQAFSRDDARDRRSSPSAQGRVPIHTSTGTGSLDKAVPKTQPRSLPQTQPSMMGQRLPRK